MYVYRIFGVYKRNSKKLKQIRSVLRICTYIHIMLLQQLFHKRSLTTLFLVLTDHMIMLVCWTYIYCHYHMVIPFTYSAHFLTFLISIDERIITSALFKVSSNLLSDWRSSLCSCAYPSMLLWCHLETKKRKRGELPFLSKTIKQ